MAPACQVTPLNPSEPGNAYLVNTRTWSQLPLSDPSSEGVSAVTLGRDDTLVTGDVNGDAYAWDTTIHQVHFNYPDPLGGGRHRHATALRKVM